MQKTFLIALAIFPALALAEDHRKYCKINGQVSEICVELNTKLDKTRGEPLKPEEKYLGDAASCYREAHIISDKKENGVFNKDYDQVNDSHARDLINDGANPKDKYVAECFRFMNEMTGGTGWRKQADERAKLTTWGLTIAEKVAKKFKASCGVEARIDNPRAMELVLAKTSKGKKVFFTGVDPEGTKYTITCDGVTVAKGKHGSSRTSRPRTEEMLAKDSGEWHCIEACGHKHIACVGTNPVQNQTCRKACEAECKGN